MKRTLEKIAVLSLSLLLVSTYAISSVVPKLLEHFSTYSRDQVELLVSLPSFGIAMMILANIWLSKILKEKISVILGSLLMVLSSVMTMYAETYPAFFCARLLLGLGIGFINARAITIIQNRYQGKELSTLLGIRGSMEVLGSTFMTFIAGRLLAFGWHMAFAVYLLALPVLLLYLLFGGKSEEAIPVEKKSVVSSQSYGFYYLIVFLLGFIFINTNVSMTMRLASFMKERNLGSEMDSSVVLSYMQIVGVGAGLVFSNLFHVLKKKTMPFALACMGLGLLLVSYASSSFLLYLGGTFAGFANGILTTTVFQDTTDDLPQGPADTATLLALFGCNMGGALSPLTLKFIDHFDSSMHFSFFFYGVFSLLLTLVLLVVRKEAKGKSQKEL